MADQHRARGPAGTSRARAGGGLQAWARRGGRLETDLIGVDLLPVDGGFVVLELNGAVEFDELYSLPGQDVYLDAARALAIEPAGVAA